MLGRFGLAPQHACQRCGAYHHPAVECHREDLVRRFGELCQRACRDEDLAETATLLRYLDRGRAA